jgi:hypothetical protein
MRLRSLLVAAVLLGLAAPFGYRAYRRAQLSPFRLWDFQAGSDFQAMDEQANREAKRRYRCTPLRIEQLARHCTLETAGIRGSVALVVDSSDRAVVIQFRSSDGSRTMREEMRKVAAGWSAIVPGKGLEYTAANGVPFAGTHWVSSNGRWTATIQFSSSDTLDIVTLRDERALARIHAGNPMGVFALDARELLNPLTTEQHLELMTRARALARTVAAERAREGERLAQAAARLPQCEPGAPDPIAPGQPADDEGPLPRAAMARAVALALPGSRIELHRGAEGFFINPDGRVESIRISRSMLDREAGVAAFGLNFTGRGRTASDQIEAGGEPTCRALAQLIVARIDGRGEVAAAHAVPVAGDAIASHILDIGSYHDDVRPGAMALVVRSTSAYGTGQWSGFVDWEEVASSDSLGVYLRAPASAGRRAHGAAAFAGPVEIENATDADIELMITGVDEGTRAVMQRPVVLPRSGSSYSGWTLLHSL